MALDVHIGCRSLPSYSFLALYLFRRARVGWPNRDSSIRFAMYSRGIGGQSYGNETL